MRFFVVYIDNPDNLAAVNQGHGEKGLVSILLQRAKGFEARVRRCVAGERDDRFMRRNPTCDSFAYFHSHLADFRVVRKLRRAQNHFVSRVVDQIDKRSIGMSDACRQRYHLVEDGIDIQVRTYDAADTVQQCYTCVCNLSRFDHNIIWIGHRFVL